jgi:hypothetical protein
VRDTEIARVETRPIEKWEEALVVLRRAWTEAFGQLKKTRFSQNTLESMVKANGETYPTEQVSKDVGRAAGFDGWIIWDQTLREETYHRTRRSSS